MSPDSNPLVEELLRNAAPHAAKPLDGRERATEALFAAGLVAASLALLALAPPTERPAGVALAAVLTALCAVASRIELRVGAGVTSAEQVVVLPMILLLPPGAVPLLVAGALALRRLPEHLTRQAHPDRLLLHLSDAWFVVAPAVIVALAAPGRPDLDSWPVYAAALGAQLALNTAMSIAREWAAFGVPPALQLRLIGVVAVVDVALAPVGLMVAILAYDQPGAIVLCLPLLGLIAFFAHERERRIQHALALSDAYRGSALLMAEMLEIDDPYTGGEHSKGVVALALAVGRQLGIDARTQRDLEFGALLHDIGKLKVPEAILNKPGKLTPEEWEVIKRHPEDGQRMLERIGGVLAEVGLTVRAHHERWDGGGYPDGLAAEAIPLNARIICACDAYSAMTTDRSYRAAMPADAAVAELHACAGTQFDPRVVEAVAAVVGGHHVRTLDLAA